MNQKTWAAAAFMFALGVFSAGCQSGGVGDPCTPRTSTRSTFPGIRVRGEHREPVVSVRNPALSGEPLPGTSVLPLRADDATIKAPQRPRRDQTSPSSATSRDERFREPRSGRGQQQYIGATADNAVYCSCRCNGADANARYCKCPIGLSVQPAARQVDEPRLDRARGLVLHQGRHRVRRRRETPARVRLR